ncbi:NnrU family protein [Jiella sp. MQZ9-1]|uniref:NnrU family protein n=1 Tax=Jiella flava TaxID=2816857 RepID=UPI001E65DBB0|nr:NnrU family protein [Jiella flava]
MIGLFVFLGVHSFRIVSEPGRAAVLRRLGEMRFKGSYSVLALIGLVLVVYGYGLARASEGSLYQPAPVLSHLALVLVPSAFILVVATYTPTGHIKRTVRHPMVLGVALWSLGHLLANGGTAEVVMFGAFFVWAVVDYLNAFSRPQPAFGLPQAKGDIVAIAGGLIASGIFLLGLHRWLIGVSPLA